MEKGLIIPNGVVLDTHEMATEVFYWIRKNVLNLTNRCVILLPRGQDQHWNVQDTVLFLFIGPKSEFSPIEQAISLLYSDF